MYPAEAGFSFLPKRMCAVQIFVSGGCKNGKSHYAQRMAKAQSSGGLYYIATMISADAEDDERIARHRRDREGWGFQTVEQPRDIARIGDKCDPAASFLLDSTTALLANEMFLPFGAVNHRAGEKIRDELEFLLERLPDIVIVSDYIFSDAGEYDELSEEYRRELAGIDRMLAARCGAVVEISFSNAVIHKGGGRDGVDIRRCISG